MEEVIHIANIDAQKRESETIFSLFCITTMPPLISEYYSISLTNYIVGMNIPFNSILTENEFANNGFEFKKGDIDICLIPIQENLQHGMNIVTPNLDKIIAIEVKTMGFDRKGKVISKKRNRKSDRLQAAKLTKLGFNDVGLLYIVGAEAPEVPFEGFDNWRYAIASSSSASEKLKNFNKNATDKFSTLGLFIGAIHSEKEVYQSSSTYTVYHRVTRDLIKDRKNPFRIELEKKISELFPFEIHINRFPIQMRGCNSCKKLSLFPQGESPVCPFCQTSFL